MSLLLSRYKDWDRRLAAYTARALNVDAVWGKTDCILTVADAVLTITGEDPASEIRGSYSTELGAAKILIDRGFRTVEDALGSVFEKMPRLIARRGDLGTVEVQGEVAAGYMTEHGLAVRAPRGLSFHPQTSLRLAFRVG